MIDLPRPKTIIEPFKIKTVEPIPMPSPRERRDIIEKFHFNLFKLPAEAVTFDLLTDSGTGAMSARQWAGVMDGDESYAGSRSFFRFEKTIADLTGMYHVIPTHQGRAAEHLLMQAMVGRGRQVIGNTHFDTTRANIEALGATAVDLPTPKLKDDQDGYIFKGDIDLEALQRKLESDASDVDMCIITVTNNSVGGLPVSMANIKSAQKLLNSHGVPLVIDCARFAENAYFIKTHEPGYQTKSIRQIVEEMFRLADAAVMSSKKDAIANIGGFIAVKDATVANEIRTRMVLTEGFPTYGGLAGRDMEAVAIGLEEALDENYLAYRIRSVAYFGEGLEKMGYSVVRPFGGHAVYINAGLTLRHLRPLDYPGQSLAVALYEALGLRSVEVGSVMLGRRDPRTGEEHAASRELVRLALPRRVYTQSHVDYMIEAAGHLHPHLESLPGYSFDYQAPFLRHFSARFRPKS